MSQPRGLAQVFFVYQVNVHTPGTASVVPDAKGELTEREVVELKTLATNFVNQCTRRHSRATSTTEEPGET